MIALQTALDNHATFYALVAATITAAGGIIGYLLRSAVMDADRVLAEWRSLNDEYKRRLELAEAKLEIVEQEADKCRTWRIKALPFLKRAANGDPALRSELNWLGLLTTGPTPSEQIRDVVARVEGASEE